MAKDRSSPKGAKLLFWLRYALEKYGGSFWDIAAKLYPSEHRIFSLVIQIAVTEKLTPLPAGPHSETQLDPIARDLSLGLELVMKVMGIIEVDRDPHLSERIVIQTHPRRAPNKELVKLARQGLKHLGNAHEGFFHHLEKFHLESIYLEELFKLNPQDGKSLLGSEFNAQSHLTLLMQWRHFIIARNYERIHFQPEGSICQLELDDLNEATASLAQISPQLRLWQSIGNFQASSNWEQYARLKAELYQAKATASLEPAELEDAFRVLLNFLLQRVQQSDDQVLTEANELFLGNIQDELFLVKGQIRPRDLKSIISIYVRLGEAKAARQFFDRFHQKVMGDPNQVAVFYNEGVVLFLEGEFAQAGKLFNQAMHSSDDFYLKADGKTYALRCLIELQTKAKIGEVEYFPGTSDSFRMFFRRQKGVSQEVYDYYLSFYMLMREFTGIWELLEFHWVDRWLKLKAKVVEFPDPYLAQWLMARIDDCISHFAPGT